MDNAFHVFSGQLVSLFPGGGGGGGGGGSGGGGGKGEDVSNIQLSN